MVLAAQSGHDHGQELLPDALYGRSEGFAKIAGDDDGEALREQLEEEETW